MRNGVLIFSSWRPLLKVISGFFARPDFPHSLSFCLSLLWYPDYTFLWDEVNAIPCPFLPGVLDSPEDLNGIVPLYIEHDGIEKEKAHNPNQLIRWVMNKEQHADEFQDIVTQYFMTQRIKPDAKKYNQKLGLLHQMLVYAMKCKQTTDLTHTAKLKSVVMEFEQLYFAK